MLASGGLASMAWRNLRRHRRRMLITLSSISFGILLAVLFTGMGDHSYSKMIDLAARMGTGHVALQHPDYQDAPSLEKTITNTDVLRELALADPDVDRVVTRISGPVMLATASNSSGAYFLGIDPTEEDAETLAGYDAVTEGELFEDATGKGIVLGKVLADNLDVTLGKKVVYTLTNVDGKIVSGLGRVKGIVDTGSPGLDGTLCLLPLQTAREALGYPAHTATHVALYTADQRASSKVAERLGPKLPVGVVAATWRQAQPELAGFISLDRAGAIVFQIIILIVIAAGIFNSLYVSVVQRSRELGIMLAVGFSPAQLFALIMWESLWLALLGLVAGVLVTAGPYLYLNRNGLDFSEVMGGEGSEISGVAFDPVIYPEVFPDHLVAIGVVVVITTLLAGVLPALRAGRVVPVEAVRLG